MSSIAMGHHVPLSYVMTSSLRGLSRWASSVPRDHPGVTGSLEDHIEDGDRKSIRIHGRH